MPTVDVVGFSPLRGVVLYWDSSEFHHRPAEISSPFGRARLTQTPDPVARGQPATVTRTLHHEEDFSRELIRDMPSYHKKAVTRSVQKTRFEHHTRPTRSPETCCLAGIKHN